MRLLKPKVVGVLRSYRNSRSAELFRGRYLYTASIPRGVCGGKILARQGEGCPARQGGFVLDTPQSGVEKIMCSPPPAMGRRRGGPRKAGSW